MRVLSLVWGLQNPPVQRGAFASLMGLTLKMVAWVLSVVMLVGNGLPVAGRGTAYDDSLCPSSADASGSGFQPSGRITPLAADSFAMLMVSEGRVHVHDHGKSALIVARPGTESRPAMLPHRSSGPAHRLAPSLALPDGFVTGEP